MMHLQMNFQCFITHCFSSRSFSFSSSSSSYSPFTIISSKRDFNDSQPTGDNNNNGDKSSRDWDKAWSKLKKEGKKTLFSPNKYVSWNPRPSDFPLSEEVDPIKRTERSNLNFWTSPTFTLVLAILILTFLLLYTILAPIK